MRNFDDFLKEKIVANKDNIIFIDLACVQRDRSMTEIHLGIKTKDGGMMGTSWRTSMLNVEDDFSISEFLMTCAKYKVQCSAFSGDNETYLLK